MKRTLAYVGHIVIATLAVPWLTILAGGLIYGVFSPFLTSVNTPQQFLSDHLMFLVVVVGASLAYAVSGTFTSRSALWVWIPATIVFVLRVLDLASDWKCPCWVRLLHRAFLHGKLPVQQLARRRIRLKMPRQALSDTAFYRRPVLFGWSRDSSRHPLTGVLPKTHLRRRSERCPANFRSSPLPLRRCSLWRLQVVFLAVGFMKR